MVEEINYKLEGEPPRRKGAIKKLAGWTVVVLLVLVAFLWNSIFENNDAQTVKVKQSVTGELEVWATPGLRLQMFGTITPYRKSGMIWFSSRSSEGSRRDESIQVRYNDGGTARLSGTIRYKLPYDRPDSKEKILTLHNAYRNEQNFIDRAIKRQLVEAVQLTAGMMNSQESYRTKKSLFSQLCHDQLQNGVYEVRQVSDTIEATNGEMQQVVKNEIILDENGEPKRKRNPFEELGVEIIQVVIYDPDYEGSIQQQIAARFQSKMQAIVAMSEARLREAEQKTKKAEGERNVEEQRYQQLVSNVKEEIEAERKKMVGIILAERDAEVAEIKKEAQKWLGLAEKEKGRGEATAKRLLQEADSNLEIKLAAVKTKHRLIAEAIGRGKPIVPEIVLGESGAGSAYFEAMGIRALDELVDRNSRLRPQDRGSRPDPATENK